ncbi:MAG: replication protein [Parcubacteria group bacterium]
MALDRFTKFPNDILDTIYARRFTARQLRIILFITRMTDGCHTRTMSFKISDFQICGLYKGAIKKELQRLEAFGVVKVSWDEGLISINTAFWEWKVPKNSNLGDNEIIDLRTKKLSKQLRNGTNLITKRANKASLVNINPSGKEIIKKYKEGFSSIGEIMRNRMP